MSPTSSSLTQLRERLIQQVEVEINALSECARSLGLDHPYRADFARCLANLKNDVFTILVAGIYNAGKSTLLNALLLRQGGTDAVPELRDFPDGLLPATDLPTTAILNWIIWPHDPTRPDYPRPYVLVRKKDKTPDEEWDLHRYAKLSGLVYQDGDERIQDRFAGIADFVVCLPLPLLKETQFVDTPGLDDDCHREDMVLDVLPKKVDVGIVVFRSDAHAHAQTARRKLEQIVAAGLESPFVVFNMVNGRAADTRYREAVWGRLVTEVDGEEYSEEGPRRRRWFFVDARAAFQARRDGDAAREERSGIATLERALDDFLLRERLPIKVERHLGLARRSIASLLSNVAARYKVVSADRHVMVGAELVRLDRIRKEIEARQARLAALMEEARRAAGTTEGSPAESSTLLPQVPAQRDEKPMTPTNSSLTQLRERLMQEVEVEVNALSECARSLGGFDAYCNDFAECLANLKTDAFKILVGGIFNAGKSTFLNALLLRQGGVELVPQLRDFPDGLLPVADEPTTAKLNWITYAPEEPPPGLPRAHVLVRRWDGHDERWDLDRYAQMSGLVHKKKDGAVDSQFATAEDAKKYFAEIQDFVLLLPLPLLEQADFADTPGLDDHSEREDLVLKSLPKLEAAIVLFNSFSDAFRKTAHDKLKQIFEAGLKPPFIVFNMMNGKVADARFRKLVWEVTVPDEEYSEEGLARRRFFFVDAKGAFEARRDGDPAREARSGIHEFEKAVDDFLLRESLPIKVERHVEQAGKCAARLLGDIVGREHDLGGDREGLEGRLREALRRLAEAKKRLAELGPIFDRYLPLLQQALKDEFADFLKRLKTEAPNRIKNQKGKDGQPAPRWLPSLDSKQGAWRIINVFKRSQLAKEASDVVEAILNGELQAWLKAPASAPGPLHAFARHMPALQDELRRVFDDIGRELKGSGLPPEALNSFLQRLRDLLAGLDIGAGEEAVRQVLAGALLAALLTGLGKVILGKLLLAVSLHVLGGIVLLPVAVLLAWSLPESINTKVLEKAAELTVKQLDDALKAMNPYAPPVKDSPAALLDSQVAEGFHKLKAQFLKEAQAIVDRQVKKIEQELLIIQGNQAGIDAQLARLAQARKDIEQRQARLRQVVEEARSAAAATA